MNPRSAQWLTALLAFLLIILIAATIFILLSRPQVAPSPSPSLPQASSSASFVGDLSLGPTAATPAPTDTPSLEPSQPAASVTPTEMAATSGEPTESPLPTPTPTPSLTAPPTPTPSPVPTVNPTAPQRKIQFTGLGLDNKSIEGGVPRVVTFDVDGQSLLTAHLSNSTGQVQLCLWREASNDERTCHTAHNVMLSRAVLDQGASVWHVSAIGAASAQSPFADLTISFNSDMASVSLENFRYNGSVDDHYNGFEALLTSGGPGNIEVQASFEGEQANYHLIIGPTGGVPLTDKQSSEPATSIDEVQPVDGQATYRVSLRDPDEVSSVEFPVFVTATISWP